MIRALLVVPLAVLLHLIGVFAFSEVLFTVFAMVSAYRIYSRARGRHWIDRTNKCVFVTGCDSGFGELTALRLDSMGVKVFAGCLTQSGADRLAKRTSNRIVSIVMDVTKDADVENALDRVRSSLSANDQFWGLVNNAGIFVPGPVEFLPMSDYQRQMEVNFFGVMRVTKAFLPLLRASKGRVVTLSSVVGLFSFPRLGAYCASKYALEAVMDALRREMYEWDVQVVMIEPGLHRTSLMRTVVAHQQGLINGLSENLKKAYGAPYLDALMDESRAVDAVQASGDPAAVCDAVLKGLWSCSPEARYQVGKDAIILVPLSYLPAWIQDPALRFLERMAGRRLPLPEGARATERKENRE